jgi:hypothetical protein
MAVSPQLVKRVETRDYALTVLPRERSKRTLCVSRAEIGGSAEGRARWSGDRWPDPL